MPELIDLVDNSGTIVERGVLRDDLKQYGEGMHIPIVIVVIINSAGELLVQKRALTKKTEPGKIDYVCGAITSGYTPKEAAIKETLEETGLTIFSPKLITEGLNVYGRYRYLFLVVTDDEPLANPDDDGVEWTAFYSIDEIKQKEQSGKFKLIKDFFEDIELALQQ